MKQPTRTLLLRMTTPDGVHEYAQAAYGGDVFYRGPNSSEQWICACDGSTWTWLREAMTIPSDGSVEVFDQAEQNRQDGTGHSRDFERGTNHATTDRTAGTES